MTNQGLMQEMNAVILRPAAKRLITLLPWRPRICTALQIYYLGACFAVALPRDADFGATSKTPGQRNPFCNRNDRAQTRFSHIGVSFPYNVELESRRKSHGTGLVGFLLFCEGQRADDGAVSD
jgi:hypothetical protein